MEVGVTAENQYTTLDHFLCRRVSGREQRRVSISPFANRMSTCSRCHLGSLQSVFIRAPQVTEASRSCSSRQGTEREAKMSASAPRQNWCSQSQACFRARPLSDRRSVATTWASI